MENSASNRRNAKKKPSAPIELPQSVLDKYRCMENLLRHTLSRKWLRYEFEYDEVELAYFTKSKTFESILSRKYPHQKHRNLTRIEWRAIRKYGVEQKIRRFSSKFVQQQRIDLEKYRRFYNVLRENKRDDQLAKLNEKTMSECDDAIFLCDEQQNQFEFYRLIAEAKKLIELKSVTVTELREMNNAKTENRMMSDDETNANATKAVTKLRDYNDEILGILKKLLHFQIVKDALLFNVLSKKKLVLALSPVYFQRKCEVRIYEDWCKFRLDTFIDSDIVRFLMKSLLELVLGIVEHEQLAPIDYLNTVVIKHANILKPIMTADDFDYFNATIIPTYLTIAKKLST
ncbi:uncharacterized protein LOC116338140 [Contarinia nasturtii]|uniref:uncharacterized protein LOC116338140 n=1 Tax=Contarinia nasturtii TaxID=265458 RepID=UPI0012D37C18|nr:uncharacterized protein LOC116338140 [Contarinia nasturtii]